MLHTNRFQWFLAANSQWCHDCFYLPVVVAHPYATVKPAPRSMGPERVNRHVCNRNAVVLCHANVVHPAWKGLSSLVNFTSSANHRMKSVNVSSFWNFLGMRVRVRTVRYEPQAVSPLWSMWHCVANFCRRHPQHWLQVTLNTPLAPSCCSNQFFGKSMSAINKEWGCRLAGISCTDAGYIEASRGCSETCTIMFMRRWWKARLALNWLTGTRHVPLSTNPVAQQFQALSWRRSPHLLQTVLEYAFHKKDFSSSTDKLQ